MNTLITIYKWFTEDLLGALLSRREAKYNISPSPRERLKDFDGGGAPCFGNHDIKTMWIKFRGEDERYCGCSKCGMCVID